MNVTNAVVNRTTIINVYNHRDVQNVTYVNRVAPNALTVVPHDTFVNARPVARSMINVPAREAASAPVPAAPAATPERSSVYGAGSRNAPRPPAQVANRPVVVKNPPAPMPNHFERPQNVERPQSAPPDRPRPATPNRPAYQPPDRSRTDVPNRQTGQTAPVRPEVRSDASRPAPQTLARPAPPVRRPTSAEQQDMKAKQKAWQNERSHNKQNERVNKDQKQTGGRPPRQ